MSRRLRSPRPLLFPIVLAVLAALVPQIGAQTPDFIEVAASRNVTFTCTYGPTFPYLSTTMTIIQRNIGNGAAVGDYDNDGDLDIYLLSQRNSSNVLLRNEIVPLGSKTFTEVTNAAGVTDLGMSRAAQFADLDNDGDLDLLLVNDDDGISGYPPSRVFRNNGNGTFADVTLGSGFSPTGYFKTGLALADYDQDGFLDLYVSNWRFAPGLNQLYRNQGNFTFSDVTQTSGLGTLDRDSHTALFHDLDGNGYPDIYVAVDHTSDEFYWNQGGTFVNATTDVGATHTGNDMGIAMGDIDVDGDMDLYVTNITDSSGVLGTTDYNTMLMFGPDGMGSWEFTDEAISRGVEDTVWGWGTRFTDVDLDGDLDLVAVTGYDEYVNAAVGPTSPLYQTPSVLFINDGTGNFTRLNMPALDVPYDSRGLIAFDYDRDGDEDLLITNINEPVRLMENVSTQPGHWLGIELEQAPGANRGGVGAAVYATSGGVTRRRDVVCGDSFMSGNPQEIILGVGADTVVSTLRVEWTDGTETTFDNVQVDRYVKIVQGVADADLDGAPDATDNCPFDVNPNQSDPDLDGYGGACDCKPLLGSVWSVPGAASGLTLSGVGTTSISWTPPVDPGGSSPDYSLLRSETRDFAGAVTCLLETSPLTGTTDIETPTSVFYYLVRVENSCGDNSGVDWGGVPRTPPACP